MVERRNLGCGVWFLLSTFPLSALPVSLLPLERALLDLVDQAEDEDADEKQNRAEDRDVVREKLAVDERPRNQDHDLEVEEHEQERGEVEFHREARVDHAFRRHAALVSRVL